MGKGRLLAATMSLGLFLSIVVMAPATAEDEPLPMCEPVTFAELGPPPNELVTIDEGSAEPADPDDPGPSADDGTVSSTEPPSEEPDGPASPDGETSDPTAGADPETPAEPPEECVPFVYSMKYPLPTTVWLGSVFGAIRDDGDRWHAGVDIAAPKLTPVLAVADGTVQSLKRETDNVWIVIRHDDGWSSAYVHLNNDTYGTDDGLGVGIDPRLEVGDPVTAGMVIGWVGDSGNAEEGVSHLHFELRDTTGMPIDPARSLSVAARGVDPELSFVGAFADDEDTATPDLFDRAIALGVPASCDEAGTRACPNEPVTRATLIEWLKVLLPERVGGAVQTIVAGAESELFSVPDAIAPVLSCESPLFCDQPVTGSELTTYLVSALAVTDGACRPPLTDTALSRWQLLRHLFRELGQVREPPCDLIN